MLLAIGCFLCFQALGIFSVRCLLPRRRVLDRIWLGMSLGLLEEMWLPSSEKARGTHFEVPEGEIFVLGDNRNGSSDSRHTGLGTVDTDYVIGRAVAAIWPMDKFGLL